MHRKSDGAGPVTATPGWASPQRPTESHCQRSAPSLRHRVTAMDVGLSVDAIAASFNPRRTGSGTSSPRLPQGAFLNNRTHVLGPVGILRGRVGQGFVQARQRHEPHPSMYPIRSYRVGRTSPRFVRAVARSESCAVESAIVCTSTMAAVSRATRSSPRRGRAPTVAG